jgi:hypothetical protein
VHPGRRHRAEELHGLREALRLGAGALRDGLPGKVVTGAFIAALTLGQITSIQLGPISVRVDEPTLRFEGFECGTVGRRRTLVTNTGKDDLFIHTSLVYGGGFNGGHRTGNLGRNPPGDWQDMEFVYAPVKEENGRGWVDVLARYHDEVITAERARIEKLAKKELDEVAEELVELIEEEKDDAVIFASMDSKARRENREAHDRLDWEMAAHRAKLMDLRNEYASKRAEMLAGNFCTGCGKTRSEILATGSTFPHPGQRIRGATPEELERLEREYDGKLAREGEQANRINLALERADSDMRRKLDEIVRKKARAEEMREKAAAKLREEQKMLEERRAELMSKLTELAGKQTATRITLLGRCTRNP